jgi:hypothetical protein
MKNDYANKEWLKNKSQGLKKLDVACVVIFIVAVIYLIDWFVEELAK